MEDINKTAVVILACADYRSLEISLACHMAFTPPDVTIYVLQNGAGTFATEQTLKTARRYARLHPDRIQVAANFKPDVPFRTIRQFLRGKLMNNYDYICKIDDDCFPIAEGWLDTLKSTYLEGHATFADQFAYATPLINNNTWGFSQTLDVMRIRDRYFAEIAMQHYAGAGKNRKIVPADQIETGDSGTIWGNAHFARWLHQETTLQPDHFIAKAKGQSTCEVPGADRYSIGCILFQKTLWETMSSPDGKSDEGMLHAYVRDNDMKILCARSVPFVHLNYYIQREENADIVDAASSVYQKHSGARYPISVFPDRAFELEARLRHIEASLKTDDDPDAKKNAFMSQIK